MEHNLGPVTKKPTSLFHSKDTAGIGKDICDTANNYIEEEERLRSAGENTRKLNLVRAALRLFDTGWDGTCRESDDRGTPCGNEISDARFQALPYATICRYCQEEKEKKEKEHGTRKPENRHGGKPKHSFT